MRASASPKRFLDLLDPDPHRAEAKYQLLRRRLAFYFRQRGARDPEDLADETVVRVTRRLAEGSPITTALPNYCYGVAALVLKEYFKEPGEAGIAGDTPATGPAAFLGLSRPEQTILMEQCLRHLPASDRAVVKHYYWGERQQLARLLNISSNALRIRVFRILEGVRAKVGGDVK